MKILVVDCREERGETIALALAEPNKRIVTYSPHVNYVGGSVLDDWDEVAKKSCLTYLKSERPDIVLLHVGQDQRRWENCFSDIYQNYVVVCFTGAPIPPVVKDGCAIDSGNAKHCYYPGLFKIEYATVNEWCQSVEGCAILKFVNEMEEYFQKETSNPEEAKEILKRAKETLHEFDGRLEKALKQLTEDLCELLLADENPTEQSIKELTEKRDRLL